jgi:hypothetical protein
MSVRGKSRQSKGVALVLASMAILAAACGSGAPAVTGPAALVATKVPATPVPTPTAEPTPLPMDVTKEAFTAKVATTKTASVTIRTDAGAKCTIEVLYDSGPSQAQGLDPKTATSGGKVIWSWKVGSNTKAGTYPITIVCTRTDHEGTLELDFTVTT